MLLIHHPDNKTRVYYMLSNYITYSLTYGLVRFFFKFYATSSMQSYAIIPDAVAIILRRIDGLEFKKSVEKKVPKY